MPYAGSEGRPGRRGEEQPQKSVLESEQPVGLSYIL